MNVWNGTPGNNALSRLHPLVKIAVLVSTAVFAFFVSNIAALGGFLAAALLCIRYWNIRLGQVRLIFWAFTLSLPALYALFILSFLWKEPTPMEGLFRGLLEGTRYSLRFLSLTLVNFAVVLSTDPREIAQALRMLRLPVVLCQILAHVINLMPRLVRELQAVVEAQTVRGMRWRRCWNPGQWLPVALPAIIAVMRFSEQTAISLELRGGMICPDERTAPFRLNDWIAGGICFAFIIMGISMRG